MIRRIQLTLLALFVSVWAMASYTSVKNADGVEIWYDFDSNTKTASVTYKGGSYSASSDEYIGEVVIPSKVTYGGEEYSVTSIGRDAFRYCSSLTSITLPESVTEIGSSAFDGCSSLPSIDVALDNNSYTSIDGVLFSKDQTILIKYPEGKKDVTSYAIPESVTEIGDDAFRFCRSLTSITIPESVTSIGDFTFYFCDYLTNITIPENVTEIGKRAFSYCLSLTSIDVASNNNNYTSINGVLFSKDKTILIKYPEGKKDVTSYAIPEGVTKIVDYAFSLCTLTSITLPEGLTKIGSYAFSGCRTLTSITIPKGVTEIGEHAFEYCSSLTSITLPEGVTKIGTSAFYDCSSLTSITIPESVKTIGEGAFNGCSSLPSIDVALDNNSFTSIDGVLFSKDQTILIKYPEGKKDVTSYAIPEGVTKIGSYAFSGCSTFTSITSMNVTPPSIGNNNTFYGVNKSIPVYVPKRSVEAYKRRMYWDNFTNIQGIDDTPITDVVADSVSIRLIGNSLIVEGAESYAVYALSGQCLGKVESLERGVYIVVADGVSKKIVVK